MSCYTIKNSRGLGTLTFSTLRTLTLKELNDPNIFIKEIVRNAKENKETLQTLKTWLDSFEYELQYQKEQEFPPIRGTQSKEILTIIANNLNSLGVTLKIIPENEFIQLFGKNVKAAVNNGEIYMPQGSTDITAPVHELLHLIMSVYKLTDYNGYSTLLEHISLLPEFLQLKEEFLRLNIEDYKGLSGIDLDEEVFNRFMERVIKNQYNLDLTTNNGLKLFDILNDELSPIILYTFSLKDKPNAIKFLLSTISKLPSFGTKIFFPLQIESTGYLSKKQYAIENAKIVNLIKEWSHPENGKPKILEELECNE